jgi:hypothetical protein
MLSSMSEDDYQIFLTKKRLFAAIPPHMCACGCLLLRRGAFEDFLRFVANEHHVLSLVFADENHPFSRNERGIAFYIMHSVMFMLVAITLNLETVAYYLVSILILSPTRIFVDYLLYYLLAAPCLVGCKDSCGKCCGNFIQNVNYVIVAIFFCASFILLWLAAIIICNAYPKPIEQRAVIWRYLYTVFIASSGQELFMIYLQFLDRDNCCCGWLVKFFDTISCGFLGIGAWGLQKKEYEESGGVIVGAAGNQVVPITVDPSAVEMGKNPSGIQLPSPVPEQIQTQQSNQPLLMISQQQSNVPQQPMMMMGGPVQSQPMMMMGGPGQPMMMMDGGQMQPMMMMDGGQMQPMMMMGGPGQPQQMMMMGGPTGMVLVDGQPMQMQAPPNVQYVLVQNDGP